MLEPIFRWCVGLVQLAQHNRSFLFFGVYIPIITR
jgi:hypothetical protein